MTRYHVNPQTGNIYKCTAQPGNCPYGEELHSENKAEIQKIADEICQNMIKDGLFTLQRKPNELFNLKRLDEKIEKSNRRVENNINRVKKLAKEKYKVVSKHNFKGTLKAYTQYKLDNDSKLQEALEANQYLVELANKQLNHRKQSRKIEEDIGDIFSSKSYSTASSSAYYMINKNNIKKLEKYLNDNNYIYNIDEEIYNNFLDIRISDHKNKHDKTGYSINIQYKKDEELRTIEETIKEYKELREKEEL